VLAHLWKKRLSTVAPTPGAVLVSATVAPNAGLPQGSLSEAPKRAHKGVRIGRLYPERRSKPLVHAQALIAFVQVQCPELIGAYVPHRDLDGAYGELCAKEGWKRCSWTAIARQLTAMKIKKRALKRNGERFRAAYRIPKV
jgi:hypothetical protein